MQQMTVVMAEALHGQLLQWLDERGYDLKPMAYGDPTTFIAVPRTTTKKKRVIRRGA